MYGSNVVSNVVPSSSFLKRLIGGIFGKPKNIHDPSIFHKLSLIPALAWVGLGADGLSSSSYGPEEAFKALGSHTYLAIALIFLMVFTIFVIAYSYTQIIEHFPNNGGGYLVASYTLGKNAGVISGCALLIDYMLTIAVSISSCGDALFSFLPISFQIAKLPFEALIIIALAVLNIRGVKESISFLVPIFVVFIVTHILLIVGGVSSHLFEARDVVVDFHKDFNYGLSTLGLGGMAALLMKAYCLGAGTYTGIEAVSNSVQVMQEPKVTTAKTTMLYMAVSLAFAAGGILLCYLLLDVRPVVGKTLNAVVADAIFGHWHWLALLTILSEGALLIVGSQTGFIGGPRVMANMAADKWLPRRLANLSERLTMRNGILLMAIPSLAIVLFTGGNVSLLVIMYSINVFLTFSISQIGMCRYFLKYKNKIPRWINCFAVSFFGFALCFSILIITIIEKFSKGGYVTVLITVLAVAMCYRIRHYYNKIKQTVRKLQKNHLDTVTTSTALNTEPLDTDAMTAIQVVHDFNGFGINIFFSILKQFPHLYKNFVFVSVAKIDSRSFKSTEEIQNFEEARIMALEKYVKFARSNNVPAMYYFKTGTDAAEEICALCKEAVIQFPKSTVFAGLLQLEKESFYHKFLHSELPHSIEKRLQEHGITTVILPIKPDV
jgi:amino acid transporter